MILKAKDYLYPTKEEREVISNFIPMQHLFKFKQIDSVFDILFDDKMSAVEATKLENLYNWNICLSNRFGKLRESFTFAITNYNRGLNEITESSSSIEYLNVFLFEYYSEIFYYFFFSARDILCQIIKVYLELDQIAEDRVTLNKKFLNLINHTEIKSALEVFNIKTKKAKDFRNAFVHKFTPTQNDYRVTETNENGNKSWGFSGGYSVDKEILKQNMIDSLNELSIMMNKLTSIISISDN